jgi:vacuolar-type H+-ATPase subunit H
MEKVWDELKKIDAEANQIQSDAQSKAKKITLLAKEDSEKLIANSRTYAEEEAQKLYSKAVEEANQNRNELLKASQETAVKLKVQAEKRMDKAVLAVVNSVLEETKP